MEFYWIFFEFLSDGGRQVLEMLLRAETGSQALFAGLAVSETQRYASLLAFFSRTPWFSNVSWTST